jgi:hypothetical protein
MIIGHLPAGYLLSTFTYMRLGSDVVSRQVFVLAGMAGAIAPDVDLLYFYLLDHRQHHHHTYFTHFPIVWLALVAISMWWYCTARYRLLPALAVMFALNGFVHLMLDSIVGDIAWFAPWSTHLFSLVKISPAYHPWWLNFIFHWSFLLELALLSCAYMAWRAHKGVTMRLFY